MDSVECFMSVPPLYHTCVAIRNLIIQGDKNKTSGTNWENWERNWGNLFGFYSVVCDEFPNIYWCIKNPLGSGKWQKTMHKNKIESAELQVL